jgi:DNA repair exonuclease SbcCD ATPase subunit
VLLTRLELVNYRQHAERTVDFTGNVIGFVGANGMGKSHLMDALHFAFAGRVPEQSKPGMITWGETKGSVRLDFTHEGDPGSIYRELDSAKATLQYRGTKVEGATKVNEVLATDLGMDSEICRQAVFVRQKEIDGILFMDPSARQLSWQRLCGLSEVPKVHTKLGQLISGLPAVVDYTNQILEGEGRLIELLQIQSDTQARLEQLRARLGPATSTQLHARLVALTRVNEKLLQASASSGRLEKAKSDLLAYQGEHAGVEAALAQVPPVGDGELERLIVELTRARALEQSRARYLEVNAATVAGTAEVRALVAPEEVEPIWTSIQTLTAEIGELTGVIALYEEIDRHSRGQAECLTCGAALADATVVSVRAQKRVDLATTERKLKESTLAEARLKLAKLNTARALWAEQFSRLNRKLAGLTAERDILAREVEIDPPAGIAELEDRVYQLKTTQSRRQELAGKLATLAGYISISQKTVAKEEIGLNCFADEILPELRDNLQVTPQGVPAAIQATTAELTVARELEDALVYSESALAQVGKDIQALTATIASLRHKMATQEKYAQALAVLNNTREWFHYLKGPQVVINTLLQDITAGVNDFLAKFGAPFAVVPDPGTMSFRYYYHDGRTVPAEYPPATELSGGEQVILAVSFRFASYCLFAGRVGLLSLDEPTVYLDDQNIGKFCHMMEKVKEVAAKMGLQILMATHEQSVIPFMDTVVNLGDTHKEGSTSE